MLLLGASSKCKVELRNMDGGTNEKRREPGLTSVVDLWNTNI